MSGRGKGKGKGGYGRGKGKGKGKGGIPVAEGPIEKTTPTFTKLKDVRPGGRTYDLVVQVGSVTPDKEREEKRGGRTFTVTCTEAVVGDETGCILLTTRQTDAAAVLKSGAHVALLNIKMRRVQDSFWLDADNWSAIKPLEQCKDLLPENFDSTFGLNEEVDRSKKIPPKPAFCNVDALEPDKRGVHMVVKVLDVQVEERSRVDGKSNKVAEATVGDAKGCVTLIARGLEAVDVLQKDAVVVVFNAHVEMTKSDKTKGFMRLIADRWSDVKPLDKVSKDLLPSEYVTADTVVDEKANKSKLEWVLVED